MKKLRDRIADWWVFSAEDVVILYLKVLGVMTLITLGILLGCFLFVLGPILFTIYMMLWVAAIFTAALRLW